MTRLLNAEFEDASGAVRKLTRQEVLTYTAVIAGAGNETTGRLIGWLAKLLAEHPDQRREVVADRSLIPTVIDETLRFEPTGHATALRHAGRGLLRHHGAGRRPILLLLAAANRDARRYPDPDVYDIHRDDIQHLTFGWGLHFCLGATSRGSKVASLDELLNRFPEWDVDYDSIELAPTSTVRLGADAAHHPVSGSSDRYGGRRKSDDEERSVRPGGRRLQRHAHRRLTEDLRSYCPIDEFDRFAATAVTEKEAAEDAPGQRIPRPPELPRRRPSRVGSAAG